MLPNAQLDLADDGEVGLTHEVERAPHGALGGVLHGDHGVVGLTGLRRPKYFVDLRVRLRGDPIAKMLLDCGVAEGPRGTEIRDRQLLFQRKARRHDLPKHCGDRFVG